MHELSLALPIAEAVIREAGGRPVTAVVLEVGALSGVVPEALELALEVALAGTAGEGARVCWRTAPGRGVCRACGGEFAMGDLLCPCPACGSPGARPVAGTRLVLESIVLGPEPEGKG